MTRLFDPNLVYPADEGGRFVDLIGTVIEVDNTHHDSFEWEEIKVVVQTEQGTYEGYTPRPPKVGYQATIRVYDAGGGWYPDNRIVGWSEEKNQ